MLALTLLVRDEEDIVEANLRFHLSTGVDFVIVTDHRSTDATPAILDRFREAGRVHVLREEAEPYLQGEWVTRMARLAHGMGATWVINGDADEFWWPRAGSLVASLASVPQSHDVVTADRRDFPPTVDERGEFWERMVYREARSYNLIGRPLGPKVCHRARADVTVAQGNHYVMSESLGAVLDDGRIEILHFPFRSYAQFERKIINGGSAYASPGAPAGVGLGWRHAYELWQAGRLRELYDQRALSRSQISELVARGELTVDTRLRDALRAATGYGGPSNR